MSEPREMAEESAEPSRFWFVGVDTTGSSALAAFPSWMEALGMNGTLEGVDLPLGAPADAYRDLIRKLRCADDVLGMVVTGHKSRLFEHARNEFDELEKLAQLCREISVVRREDERLVAGAIEPGSAGKTLATMLKPGHWARTQGEIVLFGAGGTAWALMARLYGPNRPTPDAPRRARLLDIDRERADTLAATLARWRPEVETVVYDVRESASVLEGLRAGSLIINATGLGKDSPGSPMPLPAPWPTGAIVWDLNYRGELSWMHDANAAAHERGLEVHDGWLLFLHGWSEALASISKRPLDAAQFRRFTEAADRARTG